ncbi:c-type cytochrome [Flaviaesturariibacter terrae]
MKQLLFACTLAAVLAACAHKVTPTSSTPASSSGSSTSGTTPASSSTAAAKVEAGHQVYTAKCGRCHGLKEPSNYTAERWVPILASMAPKARLSEEETAQVAAYVQANAKK